MDLDSATDSGNNLDILCIKDTVKFNPYRT